MLDVVVRTDHADGLACIYYEKNESSAILKYYSPFLEMMIDFMPI